MTILLWTERRGKNSLKSYVVHLALQFSDNVRTFFSKCNTKRPVDLFTNTVTKWNNLVLEAVIWCLEGTQQASAFSQECIFFAVFEKDSKGNHCVYLVTACFLENKSYGTLRTESPSTHLGSGSHTWTYKAVRGDPNNTVFHSRKKKEKSDGGTKLIYLRRLYRTSKAGPDFRQIVSYLEDVKGNDTNNTALLQYIFKGEELPFEVQPHGQQKNVLGSISSD